MADEITVSREYFLMLLRRAERTEDEPLGDSIRIHVNEYRTLRNAAAEYHALQNALLRAGTPMESIKVLVNASNIPTPPENGSESIDDGQESTSSDEYVPHHRRDSVDLLKFRAGSTISKPGITWERRVTEPLSSSHRATDPIPGHDYGLPASSFKAKYFEASHADRSLVVKGLPKNTTLADITKVVRGGILLNVFLRLKHNEAHVAFVDPDAAERFLLHAKRHDLYIKDKRVQISWDERQYIMPGGIAKSIYCNGATRNLVIRFPKPEVTQEIIRDDLEHIHTLQIVSIRYINGHAYISLSGVKQAITARSCMQSRSRYRGSRIEHWPDECSDEITPVKPNSTVYTQQPQHRSKISVISVNRFDALPNEHKVSDSDQQIMP